MKFTRKLAIVILLFILLGSTLAYADIHEEKDVVIEPYGYEDEYLFMVAKDRPTQFNVTSDIPINIYIMTSDEYFDISYSFDNYTESDFAINVFEKKDVTKIPFLWNKTDDQSYYLVIFNPNNVSATVSYSYQQTLSEEISEGIGNIVTGICAGTMCFIFLVLHFLVAIVCAIFMLKDADKRGKNGGVWFLVGIILGILGLIIWFVVRPKVIVKNQIQKETTKVQEDRICPNCGRSIPQDARICPYCSKKFW